MIAIIPARGGSKGLPGKNIKPLNGKPLIAYTIECALKSKRISHVVVSTDSNEIAEIALKYGAEVPFLRPDYLATDEAKAIDNYIYTIHRLSETYNEDIDSIIVLQPTSPLRLTEDIDRAIMMFQEKQADSVISYTQEAHPIFWHKYIDEEGRLINIFDDDTLANRQALHKTYYPNGAIYVFKKSIIERGVYYTENTFAYIMPRNRSIDIDYIEDFQYAEFLLSQK